MDTEKSKHTTANLNDGISNGRKVLAYKPVKKTFSMKCNIKGSGFKPKTLKFLVQADDYSIAKELTEDFVGEHINKKLHISSIIGSEIIHEYSLKEAIPVNNEITDKI